MARGIAERLRPPDTVMWLTTTWPHAVVRAEGVNGPPGTGRSVSEMLELDEATRAALKAGP
jgi:hypothetical protein